MKRCPVCNRTFDDSQSFCQEDGTRLISDTPPAFDPLATMVATPPPSTEEVRPPATFAEPAASNQPASYGWMSQSAPPPLAPGVGAQVMPPPPFVTTQPQEKTFAIVSLICGIASFVLCLGPLAGIPALILGFMALSRIKGDPVRYGGRGLAIGGMILAGLNLLFVGLYLITVLIAIIGSR